MITFRLGIQTNMIHQKNNTNWVGIILKCTFLGDDLPKAPFFLFNLLICILISLPLNVNFWGGYFSIVGLPSDLTGDWIRYGMKFILNDLE